MLINDVHNKDELSRLVISELKSLGVKYRKEKKLKIVQNKDGRKNIFRTHLHLLELTDVILANGGIVQIPQFVSICCQRILEQVETDGLFRKAGSTLRQKEIRASLESGLPLGRNHHVIDVANVLKSFFRELPEPLLSPTLQEPLIRSLLIDKTEAILMTCLLLPPLTINTLAFFMQFLHTVSLSAHQNRMSIENLAIIFTPGLMPTPSSDIQGIRLNNHVKVVELLMEHSEMIGILPQKISSKLNIKIATPSNSTSDLTVEKKKKKRRSGSLTRMFNGFKKIVGAIGSSENLENSAEVMNIPATPCITKSSKKRKIVETSGFSSKKKKELLALLPNGGLLPNTPICTKEPKKSRLSIGGRRNLKYPAQNSANQGVERRWSIVGAPWSRKKCNTSDKKSILKPLSPVVSMPNLSPVVSITDLDLPKIEFNDFTIAENQFTLSSSISNSINESCKTVDSGEFVRIPKSEYEAIKERVSSIEKRISQEFGNVRTSLDLSASMEIDPLSGPEKVIHKFERTCEQTINMTSSPTTDQLAKRLSRELKIRQSTDNRIIRSPSARKIGSIRRRSREAVRLSRNATWHITSTKNYSVKNETVTNPCKEQTLTYVNGTIFYPKSNLKRGRPNTIQTGLQNRQPLSAETVQFKETHFTENLIDSAVLQEQWTAGEEYFKNCLNHNISTTSHGPDSLIFTTPSSKSIRQNSKTPTFITTISINNETKTPMLPPKSIPRRNNGQIKTPSSVNNKSASKQQSSGCNLVNRYIQSPKDEGPNGRASIARLRAINAGMVMAKAKLFDGLGNECDKNICPSVKIINSTENRRRSNRFVINNLENTNVTNSPSFIKQRTPRRKSQHHKSPGFVQKRKKCGTTKYPDRNLFTNIVQADEIVLQPHSLKNLNNLNRTLLHSPRSDTPKIKKTLKVNSPRRIMRTPRNEGQLHASRTPLKATPIAIRNSPRLTGKYFAV